MWPSTYFVRAWSSVLWLVASIFVILGSVSTCTTTTAAFVVPNHPKSAETWRLSAIQTLSCKSKITMINHQLPQGFIIPSLGNRQSLSPLFSSKMPNDGNIDENGGQDNESSPSKSDDNNDKTVTSSRRVGGRSRQKNTLANNEKENNNDGLLSKWAAIVVPAFAVVFLLKSVLGGLFFGGAADGQSSYVYYQSSVYETRSYGSDGKVETSRKESVRTNAPSLVNSQRVNDNARDDSTSRSRVSGTYLLEDIADDDFDEEIESIIRQERRALRNELLDF
mmetsp:Transcript_2361/g.3461  ORF Transcript_2361/g.3461 Transcript_2361/m.3461 type:complete len:279 (+) Transcript_2361:152-988(+)